MSVRKYIYFLNLKYQAHIQGLLSLKGYSCRQFERTGPLDINQSAREYDIV